MSLTRLVVPIRDGRIHFLGQSLAEVVRGLYAANARRAGLTLPALNDIADVPAIPAHVNHGRWIVQCPDCPGAEYVFMDQPIMMCNSCWNAAVGGKWRWVDVPSESKRRDLEAVLEARPLPQTRNWLPHEKVADLVKENLARKLPPREVR